MSDDAAANDVRRCLVLTSSGSYGNTYRNRKLGRDKRICDDATDMKKREAMEKDKIPPSARRDTCAAPTTLEEAWTTRFHHKQLILTKVQNVE